MLDFLGEGCEVDFALAEQTELVDGARCIVVVHLWRTAATREDRASGLCVCQGCDDRGMHALGL